MKNTKLEEMLETAEGWDKPFLIEFCDRISQNITISIRSIWADEEMKDRDKVEAIKWINEFHHRINNIRLDIKTRTNVTDRIQAIFENARDYAQENAHANAGISISLIDSFNLIQEKLAQYTTYTPLQSSIFRLIESANFRKRMPMYIGEKKLSILRAYMDGYFYATYINGIGVVEDKPPFEGFNDWIAAYFGWGESTAGWTHIILKECADNEKEAVDRFLELYDEFKSRQH
ncbi:MAG: hypothetical protein V4714_22435 [Bacteroidota bacterium]